MRFKPVLRRFVLSVVEKAYHAVYLQRGHFVLKRRKRTSRDCDFFEFSSVSSTTKNTTRHSLFLI